MAKPTVYLAGPISGCNSTQLHKWRDEVKHDFQAYFDFLDPTENLIQAGRTDFEVVKADEEAIRSSDAVLANMWRESIGTAIGVMHAHAMHRIAVVSDPNSICSRPLSFYADAVEKSPREAAESIKAFLDAHRLIAGVKKSDGTVEPFDRRKLGESIRRACVGACQSDIAPAHAAEAKATKLLLDGTKRSKIITTSELKAFVWEAMASLAAEPGQLADYDAIRVAWEAYKEGKSKRKLQDLIALRATIHDRPLDVRISSGPHSLIWGHKVGAEAARIFEEIAKVEGITEIRFGPFRNAGPPPARPHVRLQASKTANLIDGNCYDHGTKGTLQTFQIRVADDDKRDGVLAALRFHLQNLGLIRAAATNSS